MRVSIGFKANEFKISLTRVTAFNELLKAILIERTFRTLL